MKNKMIKSKKRVAEFGEVFTAEREVNAMLDMVGNECNRIDSRFLEPACGNGNFLIEILKRKIKVVHKKYSKNQSDYEKYLFVAISSIYGIDIQDDNVAECIDRLYKQVEKNYKRLYKNSTNPELLKSIQYVLSVNILQGDGISGEGKNHIPITFSEWSMIGNKVKRREFSMNEMLAYSDVDKKNVLKPIKEYNLISFKEVYKFGEREL